MEKQHDFLEAIRQGDTETVRSLLSRDPDLLTCHDDQGISALMLAAYHRHPELVTLLAADRADLTIHEAAVLGHGERIRQLLEQDPSMGNLLSVDGFTPLGLAAFFGNSHIVEQLLSAGADPNIGSTNRMHVRPIHSAAAHSDMDIALRLVRCLLEHGAEVNVAQSGGWTPLHQAAAHGREELVRLLLEWGADTRIESETHKTPHQMAVDNGYPEVASLLDLAE